MNKQRHRAGSAAGELARRRRWWRWVAVGVVTILIVAVVAVVLFIKLRPSPAPLAIPKATAQSPVGPLSGTWHVGPGSLVGFRVQETSIGISSTVVGRTDGVTGTVLVSANRITAATFRVDLATIKVNGKTEAAFDASLDTTAHPYATFALTKTVALNQDFATGAMEVAAVRGELTMRGNPRQVTFTVSTRRDGDDVEVAGSISVQFSRWEIQAPKGYGFLGSLANHGVAEFLLVLHRR